MFWVKQVTQHIIGNVKPEGIKHSNEVECMQKINGNFCFNCKFNQTYGCEKLIDRISVDDRAKYSDADKRPDRFGTYDAHMKEVAKNKAQNNPNTKTEEPDTSVTSYEDDEPIF
jgi:hypothetical protein